MEIFPPGEAEYPLLFGRGGRRGDFPTSPGQWYPIRGTMPGRAIRAQSKCLLPSLDTFCLSPRASLKRGGLPPKFRTTSLPETRLPSGAGNAFFCRRKGVHCGGDACPRDNFVAQVVGDGVTFRQNADREKFCYPREAVDGALEQIFPGTLAVKPLRESVLKLSLQKLLF